MFNVRPILLCVAVLLPYYLAVFGRPAPQDFSVETVEVANLGISVEGKIREFYGKKYTMHGNTYKE